MIFSASVVVLGIVLVWVLWPSPQFREWIPTGPTPDVPGYGEYIYDPNLPFPTYLDCSIVPLQISLGPSWNNLQIGKTTFEEMMQILNTEDVRWLKPNGAMIFEYIDEAGKYDLIFACFSGDVLSVLDHSPAVEEYSFSGYFIQKYKKPAYVTWSGYATERAAIWPEEGILVTLEDSGGGPEPTGVILYSPIPLEEFGNSWLWQALPDKNEDLSYYAEIDIDPLPPQEDPWGIAKYNTTKLREVDSQ
jgi:hypothetical protein